MDEWQSMGQLLLRDGAMQGDVMTQSTPIERMHDAVHTGNWAIFGEEDLDFRQIAKDEADLEAMVQDANADRPEIAQAFEVLRTQVEKTRQSLVASHTLDAQAIRETAFGQSRSRRKQIVVSPFGIAIRNAVVSGRLDLSNLAAGEGSFPALQFRNCRFDQGVTLSHARLSHISFEDCVFNCSSTAPEDAPLNLEDCCVELSVSLKRTKPLDPEHGLFWIAAACMRVGGSVNISGCELRSPEQIDRRSSSHQSKIPSLGLSACTIAGDMTLLDGTLLDGSFSLRGATVGTGIWITGPQFGPRRKELDGTPEPNIYAHGLQVGGSLSFDDTADVENHKDRELYLSFVETSVKGSVWINLRRAERTPSVAVNGYGLVVGRDLRVSGYLNELILDRVDVAETIDLSGCTFPVIYLDNPGNSRTFGSNERRDQSYVSLNDGCIGGTFRIDRNQSRSNFTRLERARRYPLNFWKTGFLSRIYLFETSWSEHVNGTNRRFDVGFLQLDGDHFLLNGSSLIFHQIMARFGHAINDRHKAFSFAKVFARYIMANEGAFIFVNQADVEALGLHRENDEPATRRGKVADARQAVLAQQAELTKLTAQMLKGQLGRDHHDERKAALKAELQRLQKAAEDLSKPGSGLDVGESTDQTEETAGNTTIYRFTTPVLYGRNLRLCKMSVTVEGRRATVSMEEDSELQDNLMNAPTFGGFRLYKATSGPPGGMMPPLLDDYIDLAPEALRALEQSLAPRVSQTFNPSRVDLKDLECETLADGDGANWRDVETIELQHFTYQKVLRENFPDAEVKDRQPSWKAARRAWTAFMESMATDLTPSSIRFVAWQEWRPFAWWCEKRVRREEANDTGWRARRNWIFKQYRDRYGFPSLGKYRFGRSADYHPQPLEQAIRVTAAEGREGESVNFAILKRDIEWRLFSMDSRWKLALAGLGFGAALAWVFSESLIGALACVIMGGLSGYLISSVVNFFFRVCFGYLLRPDRAAVSLIMLFSIGWLGVVSARSHDMLVLDVKPMATLAQPQDMGAMRVGTEVARTEVADRIACGESIRPTLYALDLMIPLVDLHEEEKCEVGRVAASFPEPIEGRRPEGRSSVPSASTLTGPAPLPSQGSTKLIQAGPVQNATATQTTGLSAGTSALRVHTGANDDSIWRSEQFWAALKATYAILGWIVVSLSILTFANSSRSGTDKF